MLFKDSLMFFYYNIQRFKRKMDYSNSPNFEENVSQKRNYSRIPLKKKLSLIKMVYRRRRPLEEAIAELNLKKTTAVNIIKKFKETGSLPMRKFKRTRKIGRKNHREIIPDVSQGSSSPRVDQIKVEEESEERMEAPEQVVVQPTVEEPSIFNSWAYMPLYFYSYI